MRTLHLGILLAVFLPASAIAQEIESCEFRIVDWNVSGKQVNLGNDARVVASVIKYVEEIDANVITLQEVTDISLGLLEAELPDWDCEYDLFGVDYIAICVDGTASDFSSKPLETVDPDRPPADPNDRWWGYVQVEYEGVLITSVHSRSLWADQHLRELYEDVQTGIIAGDFNPTDPEDPADLGWHQTASDLEWTWEGPHEGEPFSGKIDHVLTVEEPQQASGDARDKEGSDHRVVLGEVTFQEDPTISAVITNAQQPIEVDGSCMATVEFQLTLHDNCCLDPSNLALDVRASNPTANATLDAVSIDSIVALGPRDVEVTGHVDVSALESCPAEIVIEATAEDCAGFVADTAALGTGGSVLALDTTAPEITGSDDDLFCLWPPNHEYVCFDADEFNPVITDNCAGTSTWQFEACTSNQPDNGRWDGNTIDDCVLDGDARGFCARSERAGRISAGRRYDLDIEAMDACGNVSATTEIGNVHVPRDQSSALMCVAPPAP
jgi:hypothetical protein